MIVCPSQCQCLSEFPLPGTGFLAPSEDQDYYVLISEIDHQ